MVDVSKAKSGEKCAIGRDAIPPFERQKSSS